MFSFIIKDRVLHESIQNNHKLKFVSLKIYNNLVENMANIDFDKLIFIPEFT